MKNMHTSGEKDPDIKIKGKKQTGKIFVTYKSIKGGLIFPKDLDHLGPETVLQPPRLMLSLLLVHSLTHLLTHSFIHHICIEYLSDAWHWCIMIPKHRNGPCSPGVQSLVG